MARTYRSTAHCGLTMMGHDFYATIDFTIRPGRPATWCKRIGTWDPPEEPEWEVDVITLQLDEQRKYYPKWKLTGAMLDCIADLDEVREAIMTADYVDVEDWTPLPEPPK